MCETVEDEVINSSSLSKAMLFELSVARAEQLMFEEEPNLHWPDCLDTALNRQRVYFDAQLPRGLQLEDKYAAEQIATNLQTILRDLEGESKELRLVRAPQIPGFQWIATSNGDFALGSTIIEIKCSRSNFSAADYRQVLIYWLLSYLSSLESDAAEYREVILINPRRNQLIQLTVDEILQLVASGRSKLEIAQLFTALVSEHVMRIASE